MSGYVFDASALLAVAFNEPGADEVMNLIAQYGGEVSAVNWSEVAAKLAEHGVPEKDIARELSGFGLTVVPFDEAQALLAAALRTSTRKLGLSIGDRSCLALAKHRKARAVTADSSWLKLAGHAIFAVRKH
ncbi:MAG: type II toxin-antitoxin system VapC family toxin [Proteobacteria bacterium]|nr:type II toxin-antitoxin system VapC family toxin [Pseudomonadota bacterium]